MKKKIEQELKVIPEENSSKEHTVLHNSSIKFSEKEIAKHSKSLLPKRNFSGGISIKEGCKNLIRIMSDEIAENDIKFKKNALAIK